MEFSLETIQALVNLATEKQLSELTLEQEEQKITIKTGYGAATIPQAVPAAPIALPAKAVPEAQPAPQVPEPASAANLHKVTSPMVGTFYRSPGPAAAPFVEAGSPIAKGDVLCIIEAMKLMNELESEVSGVVRKVLVENGTPVEFGQPLMEIEVQPA